MKRQSKISPFKWEDFQGVLNLHINCVEAIFRKYRNRKWPEKTYYYFDINAGWGNDYHSPIVFLKEMYKRRKISNLDFHAVFIEKDREHFECLMDKVICLIESFDNEEQNYFETNITLEEGDHEEIMRKYYSDGADKFGLLYHDPDGIPSFGLLRDISKVYNRLDFLINCPATAIKRTLKNNICRNHTKRLSTHLYSITKKYWIIRSPISPWQWTRLLGTNWDAFPEFRKRDFFKLKSIKGREIMNHLDYTNNEKGDRI